MKVILFVDDERLITKALSQLFDDDHFLYVYKNSGLEALEYMAHNQVDLLCSDIVMPGMDGFVLLGRVQELYPDITRVALSSFHQNNHTKRLLDQNLAQFIMFKPWDAMELKRNIYKILNIKTSLYSKEMFEIIRQLDHLPTIPKVYKELMELIKADSPVGEISKVIQNDPSIAAVVLKIANTAYYGRKTGDINQSIMNIGLDSLKNIVLAHGVFEEITTDMTLLQEIWDHAALSNKIMTAIYTECLKKPVPNMYGSAGLLHDIGKLMFFTQMDSYPDMIEISKKENRSIELIEKEKYGVCHQDIGGYILNNWDLPFAYVEAAMFHHRPLDYRVINRELVSVIHLAHFYSDNIYSDFQMEHVLDHKAFVILNIKKEDVEKLVEQLL